MGSFEDLERWTDGGCTWLPDGFWQFNWQDCCIVHDLTDNNVELFNCLVTQTGWWAIPIISLAIGIMILVQPLYVWMHKKGWIK